jgi:hypothetical protein
MGGFRLQAAPAEPASSSRTPLKGPTSPGLQNTFLRCQIVLLFEDMLRGLLLQASARFCLWHKARPVPLRARIKSKPLITDERKHSVTLCYYNRNTLSQQHSWYGTSRNFASRQSHCATHPAFTPLQRSLTFSPPWTLQKTHRNSDLFHSNG